MPSGFQLARRQADDYESYTRTFMDGSAELLVAAASLCPGDVVLDLACGTGLVARHAISRVTPGGRVVGADVNPSMLAVAGSVVGEAVEWVEAPVEAMPFDDETFTHVICQQGIQFFPDPGAAMSEIRRVLRPGGVLQATVWATPGRNPYIENQLELLGALDPSVAPSVARATPTNADDFLRGLASSAGFDGVDVALLEHTVDIADFGPWFLAQTGSTPWGPSLAALPEVGRREVADAMGQRMRPFANAGGGHRIPFASFRLTARRPTTPAGRVAAPSAPESSMCSDNDDSG